MESDPTSPGSLLPLINQLSTEANNFVDRDAVGHSSSRIASLQVDLLTEEQGYAASSSESDIDSTTSDNVLDSRLNTPQAVAVGLAQASPRDRSFPSHYVPSTNLRVINSIFGCVHRGPRWRQVVRRGRR